MKLSEKVIINTHYTRSINIERDADSLAVVKSYIPTSRALRTLSRIAETFSEHPAPRAWSLIGPYGSGKSSFSVFLEHLLSDPAEEGTKLARKILRETDPSLTSKYTKEVKSTVGYLKVLISGTPEPMSRRILKGIADAAKQFWDARRGKNNKIVDEFYKLANKERPEISEILYQIDQLQIELSKASSAQCRGILLIIDELGKFLEYEARHYGANDIFLLQALAEHAFKGGKVNLYLFVLLHQPIEQYAKGLGENLKNEWAKVQGRFEEIPFLESAEQVLRVVAAAFEHHFTKAEEREIKKSINEIVGTLVKEEALPGTLTKSEASQLFLGCYPLHPITAILLPILCHKVAQNERTLFSYLGSHEENGLQDILSQLDKAGEWVYPQHIFDYFISNQSAVITDRLTHRRWAEVVTAIERLGDAPPNQMALLKTIGILNIVGSKGGFKASKQLLKTCFSILKHIDDAIKTLSQKSIIMYRRFNGEYRVWQGSDFDIEEALAEVQSSIGMFSLADELNKNLSMLPIVARKHTIEKGTLRYFIPHFIDSNNFTAIPKQDNNPRIIFYLAVDRDDEKLFHENIRDYYSDLDIIALDLNGPQLREAVSEVIALEQVGITCQELNSDPVARREYQDRIAGATRTLDKMLKNLIEAPGDHLWYWKGNQLRINNRRSLQNELSAVLNHVYSKTPIIHNELINRDTPSSQAAAGRNKLLYAMLNHESEPDLGIEKFPPEKAIYRAVLRKTGIHQEAKNGQWAFVIPPKNSSVYHVWKKIEEFLASTEIRPRSFTELSTELMAPPFGVKEGILPILYVAAYFIYQYELALYENRIYSPYFTEEQLERFIKVPHEFSVQRFRIDGMRASIFEQYTKALYSDGQSKTIIELIRPLAKFIGGLEEYTKKTKSSELSNKAQSVRDAFNLAKSPEKLLFENLPNALGYDVTKLSHASESELEGFSIALMDTLHELKYAYSKMLEKQQKQLTQAFHLDPNTSLFDLRRTLSGRYMGLEQYTVDIDGLRAFIKRLTKTEGDDDTWFNNILMFLGHKPANKWIDANRSEAEIRLSDYSKRILDLELLRLHYDRSAKNMEGDFDVILLKSLKKGAEPINEVVAIDNKRHEAIQEIKEKLSMILNEYHDHELQLGVLAEFVDEFLIARRNHTSNTAKQKSRRLRNVTNE